MKLNYNKYHSKNPMLILRSIFRLLFILYPKKLFYLYKRWLIKLHNVDNDKPYPELDNFNNDYLYPLIDDIYYTKCDIRKGFIKQPEDIAYEMIQEMYKLSVPKFDIRKDKEGRSFDMHYLPSNICDAIYDRYKEIMNKLYGEYYVKSMAFDVLSYSPCSNLSTVRQKLKEPNLEYDWGKNKRKLKKYFEFIHIKKNDKKSIINAYNKINEIVKEDIDKYYTIENGKKEFEYKEDIEKLKIGDKVDDVVVKFGDNKSVTTSGSILSIDNKYSNGKDYYRATIKLDNPLQFDFDPYIKCSINMKDKLIDTFRSIPEFEDLKFNIGGSMEFYDDDPTFSLNGYKNRKYIYMIFE